MKMQKKIFTTFMLVIAIPTVVFLILILEISTRMVEKRTIFASELVVKESVKRIDTLLNNYRKASMQIYYNQNIIDILENLAESGIQNKEDIEIIGEVLGGMVNADKYLMSAVLRSGDTLVFRGSLTLGITDYLDENRNSCLVFPGKLTWIPSKKIKAVFGLDAFYFGAMRFIRKDDLEIGELLFLIREEFFNDIYAGAIPEDTGQDFIIAPDATIISSPDENLIGSKIENREILNLIEGTAKKSGSFPFEMNGQKSYLIFAKSDESGWLFIRQIKEKQILSGIIRLRQSLIGIIILFCSFLIFLTYFFSQGLSRPVNNLVRYIDGIGAENLGIPPPSGKLVSDEISKLHEHVCAMSFRIESLIAEVSQNERLKTQAELKALRAHISPHFIYNTLDTIRWMAVINKQDNIKKMVSALDNLMRYAADYEKALISLDEEMDIIDEYIFIQKMRYSDIKLIRNIPPEAGVMQVNKFILQTIVENSIVHGFRDYRDTGTITISAVISDNVISLKVEDDGRGFDPEELSGGEGPHSGLKSVDQRLKLNYGPDYGLVINSRPGQGTVTVVSLPASGGEYAKNYYCS
ncbi:MAG: histidine kinase [Spirochaetales bacterium]|nr:histidine kinase [Spirochaetales bacterium]